MVMISLEYVMWTYALLNKSSTTESSLDVYVIITSTERSTSVENRQSQLNSVPQCAKWSWYQSRMITCPLHNKSALNWERIGCFLLIITSTERSKSVENRPSRINNVSHIVQNGHAPSRVHVWSPTQFPSASANYIHWKVKIAQKSTFLSQ